MRAAGWHWIKAGGLLMIGLASMLAIKLTASRAKDGVRSNVIVGRKSERELTVGKLVERGSRTRAG